MVRVIVEMVGGHGFTLAACGVPQRSVLAPLLFNIYICGLPTTVSTKYACAELAIVHADGDWEVVEGVLSKDVATADKYLHTWKLKKFKKIVHKGQHCKHDVASLPPHQQGS